MIKSFRSFACLVCIWFLVSSLSFLIFDLILPASNTFAEDEIDLVLVVVSGGKTAENLKALQETWFQLVDDFPLLIFSDKQTIPSLNYIDPDPAISHYSQNLDFAQYKWKYLPPKLLNLYPHSRYYLVVDDDVFLYPSNVLSFVQNLTLDPWKEAVVIGADSFSTGFKQLECLMLKATLNFTNEQLLPCKSWTLIPGGSMLFTHEALRRLADPWILHRCVDDLLMLRAAEVYPYLGGYNQSYYNQDHLFSWCLQVRMGGSVQHFDDPFVFYGGGTGRFGRLYFEMNVLTQRLKTDWFHCTVKNWKDHGLAVVHKIDAKIVNEIWEQCKFVHLVDPDYEVVPFEKPPTTKIQARLMVAQLRRLKKQILEDVSVPAGEVLNELNMPLKAFYPVRNLFYYLLLEEELARSIIDETDPKELQFLELVPAVEEALHRKSHLQEDFSWYANFLKKLELEVNSLTLL